ncbi:hypothetical protein CHLRE_09g401750v5 [Chlamydomonas reinhardtii]|uniref:TauD/TfdA-like domain-containing protein n=1 Tax=Chlamydomonas reinhardtii TaxID=3055 RepID=A0A2K3DCS3_CHLRE|nr:uncharacterized protein CHLRE_09g401750v5 [Chlamydomonas reinhardtii]PNW78328.1 hypothetical protein CHLRE_09g401750v5 [Chlamydomonas reinhardtii]
MVLGRARWQLCGGSGRTAVASRPPVAAAGAASGPGVSSPDAAVGAPAAGLPAPRTGRSVWYGPDLASRQQEWTLELSEADVAEVEAAVAQVLAQEEAAGRDPTRRLAQLTPEDFPLPSLAPRLQALREELLRGRGFALLRRLPVERYSRMQAAASFMGLGAHLGSARSQNGAGHVLGHVTDLGLSSSDPSVRIYQTRERQTFHTDSCDVVGLLCLREAARGGDSLLVSADTLFNEMRRRCPELLARLLVPMPHDRRGEVPEGQQPWFDIPVFSWHNDEVTVFYQRQYFDSAQRFPAARRLSPADVAALDALDALANDAQLHLSMRLAPGDMQFVHNHNMLHDRTGFQDWPEPERRRHLLRLWLAVPGARELPPVFAARYGSLEVGNRGGIIVPGTQLQVPLQPAQSAAQ